MPASGHPVVGYRGLPEPLVRMRLSGKSLATIPVRGGRASRIHTIVLAASALFPGGMGGQDLGWYRAQAIETNFPFRAFGRWVGCTVLFSARMGCLCAVQVCAGDARALSGRFTIGKTRGDRLWGGGETLVARPGEVVEWWMGVGGRER